MYRSVKAASARSAADQKNSSEYLYARKDNKEVPMKHVTLRAAALMLALLMLFVACSPSAPTYQVVFNLNGGELVSGSIRQTVQQGQQILRFREHGFHIQMETTNVHDISQLRFSCFFTKFSP